MKSDYKKQVFEDAAKVAHLTLQIGESDFLRKKSQVVDVNKITSPEIKSVITKLKKGLREFRKITGKGRGIAAVQIGIPIRIAVIYIDKKIATIINPKIITKSKNQFYYPEICMSANPVIAKVKRPEWVDVEYLDETGNKKLWNNKENFIQNRVFQHEIDHMEGIINIDLVFSNELILDSDPNYLKNAKPEKAK